MVPATDNISALIRADDNWHDMTLAQGQDESNYPNREMVLFHDLFWMSDLLMLLRTNGLQAATYPVVYKKIVVHL